MLCGFTQQWLKNLHEFIQDEKSTAWDWVSIMKSQKVTNKACENYIHWGGKLILRHKKKSFRNSFSFCLLRIEQSVIDRVQWKKAIIKFLRIQLFFSDLLLSNKWCKKKKRQEKSKASSGRFNVTHSLTSWKSCQYKIFTNFPSRRRIKNFNWAFDENSRSGLPFHHLMHSKHSHENTSVVVDRTCHMMMIG